MLKVIFTYWFTLSLILVFPIKGLTQIDTTQIVETPEVLAKPPYNTEREFLLHLYSSIKYPALAAEYDIQGKIIMSFVVEKNGKLTNIFAKEISLNTANAIKTLAEENKNLKKPIDVSKKIKDIEKQMVTEATKALGYSKLFTPAIDKGKVVRSRYEIPINYKM